MSWLLVLFVRAYQMLLSPLLPPACRYYPSCSNYAIEALEKHGAWRGGWMAVRRILRCHPVPSGWLRSGPVNDPESSWISVSS